MWTAPTTGSLRPWDFLVRILEAPLAFLPHPKLLVFIKMLLISVGFSCGSGGKNQLLAVQEDTGSSPSQGRSLTDERWHTPSIFAWKIPRIEGTWGLQSKGA